MFQPHIDRLIAFVSEPEFQAELQTARREYFEHTGEVFETDDAFEMRMASFLEWFLFDRKLIGVAPAGSSLTPAELYFERNLQTLDEENKIVLRNFAHTVHSLFEVGKLKPDTMHMKDLFTGKNHPVFERRKPVGIDTGDIVEARLILTPDNKLMFSPSFCFHPRDAKKAILKYVKAQKKLGADPKSLIFKLAYLRLKVDRYKHVSADKLYAQELAT
jgi:hypothetical protein